MVDIIKLTPVPWVAEIEDGYFPSLFFPPLDDRGDRRELVIAFHSNDGEANATAKFIALARNAFDVMMRRSKFANWTVSRNPNNKMWYVNFYSKGFETITAREKAGYVEYHPDPFTALVEADKWYRENVEKQVGP